MKSAEFHKIITWLEIGTGHQFDEVKLVVWFDVLGDLPVESLQAAAKRCLQEHEGGWPTPATLRRYAVEYEQCVLMDHGEAFQLVIKAVRVFSGYRKTAGMASLPEMARKALERCGGWGWACDITVNDRLTLAAQYRGAYKAVAVEAQRNRVLTEDVRPKLEHETAAIRFPEKKQEFPQRAAELAKALPEMK